MHEREMSPREPAHSCAVSSSKRKGSAELLIEREREEREPYSPHSLTSLAPPPSAFPLVSSFIAKKIIPI